MGIKLKALGLGLLGALAVGGVGVVSAPADTGGHFTSDVEWTHFKGGQEGSLHENVLIDHDLNSAITCKTATYTANVAGKTQTEITVEASYAECKTTAKEGFEYPVTVNMNGCAFVSTIGDEAGLKHHTLHLECPVGKEIKLSINPPVVGECHIYIPPQTPTTGGVAYKAIEVGGKHALTADIIVEGITQKKEETGFGCGGAGGHSNDVTADSTVIVEGFDTAGSPVNITATTLPPPVFKSEVGHSLLTGSQVATNKFTFGVLLGTFECEETTVDGTVASAEVETITVKPAYSKCEGTKREVTTHMNGCAYVLKITGSGADGKVEIECPAGKAIETTVDKFPEGCTLTIGAQTPNGVVDYEEKGSGSTRDLLLTWTLEGIHYTRDGCEIGGTGNNGTYTGSVTLEAENTSGEQKGIWIE
jgi:hypothetical protein